METKTVYRNGVTPQEVSIVYADKLCVQFPNLFSLTPCEIEVKTTEEIPHISENGAVELLDDSDIKLPTKEELEAYGEDKLKQIATELGCKYPANIGKATLINKILQLVERAKD